MRLKLFVDMEVDIPDDVAPTEDNYDRVMDALESRVEFYIIDRIPSELPFPVEIEINEIEVEA